MKEYYGDQRMIETLSRYKEKLSDVKNEIISARESSMTEITSEEVEADCEEVFGEV